MTRVFGFSFPSGKRSDRVQTGRFLAHFQATDKDHFSLFQTSNKLMYDVIHNQIQVVLIDSCMSTSYLLKCKRNLLWALTVECNFRASKHATVIKGSLITKVVYICSIIWLLAGESSDLAQAEKKIPVIKPEQTHKMTIIFTQNSPKLSF